jgi:hypothetical protein
MGVERSVTCWYIQRQIILNEIALLKEQLKYTPSTPIQPSDAIDARIAELLLQLAKAQEKLNSLGPCPRPMMG